MKSPKKPILSVKQKKVDIAPFVFMEPKTDYDKGDKVGPFISDMLGFYGQLHMFHLNTRSYARHKALDKAYKELPEVVDSLSEIYLSGENKKIFPITDEFKQFESPEELFTHMHEYANSIKQDDRAIANKLDDVASFAAEILYLLKMH